MRFHARVDDNHAEIVAALRHIGCFVQSLAAVGKGCVDLLVAFRGKWFVIEVKDGSKQPHQQKLSPDEQEWHAKASRCAPVYIARSVDEAIAIVCGKHQGENHV